MKYPDYKYVDTASGGVHKRNTIQEITSLKYSKDTDCYRTYFRYPEEFKSFFDKTKSIRGYSGMAYADFLPIDIDNADLREAQRIAREFLARITTYYPVDMNSLSIFFSGSKGFHIFIPSALLGIAPSSNIAQIFKKFAEFLLGGWSIKYDSQIYDTTRLFRVNNTRHSKTGLFKIQLSAEEIIGLDIAAIKKLAENKRNGIKALSPKLCTELSTVYNNAIDSINQKPSINKIAVDINQELPKNTKLCYHEMLKGVSVGGRDAVTYRLACYFKRQGLQEDMILNLLLAWNTRNSPPLSDKDIEFKVKSAFSSNAKNDFGCNDDILRSHCQRACYLLGKSNIVDESIVSDCEKNSMYYETYVDNLKRRLCYLDIPGIGPAMRGISPGEVLTILARAGVGKTALMINLMHRLGKYDFYQLFFSMEMPNVMVFERMVQCAAGIEGSEVESAFTNKNLNENSSHHCEQISTVTKNIFKKVLVVDRDFLTVEEMIAIVKLAEQKVNNKIGVVYVDYMGRMKNAGATSYETLSKNALAIKHMAKELDVAVICAAQVSRKGGDGSEAIDLSGARDSGQVEEAADFVVGMWRKTGECTSSEDSLIVSLLKNRKGPLYAEKLLKFYKSTMRIDDPTAPYWRADVPEDLKPWSEKDEDEAWSPPESFTLADDCPF